MTETTAATATETGTATETETEIVSVSVTATASVDDQDPPITVVAVAKGKGTWTPIPPAVIIVTGSERIDTLGVTVEENVNGTVIAALHAEMLVVMMMTDPVGETEMATMIVDEAAEIDEMTVVLPNRKLAEALPPHGQENQPQI